MMTQNGVFELSRRQQILVGIGTLATLLGTMFVAKSLLPLAALLGAGIAVAFIRNGVASIFGFIILNLALTIHGKESLSGNIPTAFDLVVGAILASITAYWLVKIRLIERQQISESIGILFISLFAIWSIAVTIIGLHNDHNSFGDALREMLNLSPFLILPILYERFVKPDSRQEYWLTALIIASGFITITWNILIFRNNVAEAFYLYQTERATADLTLTCLMIPLLVSLLMVIRKKTTVVGAILFLIYALAGLVISLTRAMYIAVFVGVIIVLLLGTPEERRSGIKRGLVTFCVGSGLLVPTIFAVRILRLLVFNFGLRFLSIQKASTDPSLLNRYAEWRDEWNGILKSPILGHGFGTQFRTFNIIDKVHLWMGFSHNSYIYLIFKTGFIGGLLFIIANGWFLYKSFQLARSPQLSIFSRTLVRAVSGFLVAILIGAYVGPAFDRKSVLIWMGISAGVILACDRKIRNFKLSNRERLTIL